MTLKVRILQFGGSNNFDQKCSKKISRPFLLSVEYYLQFEKFLSNSVDMVKILLVKDIKIRKEEEDIQN